MRLPLLGRAGRGDADHLGLRSSRTGDGQRGRIAAAATAGGRRRDVRQVNASWLAHVNSPASDGRRIVEPRFAIAMVSSAEANIVKRNVDNVQSIIICCLAEAAACRSGQRSDDRDAASTADLLPATECLLVAAATPVTPSSRPDAALPRRRHVATLLAAGCDGIALFGTTGEGLSSQSRTVWPALEACPAAGHRARRLIVSVGAVHRRDRATSRATRSTPTSTAFC